MDKSDSRRPFSAMPAAAVILLLVLSAKCPAAGYTTESPEVKASVDKAVKFLEGLDGPIGHGVGAQALVGIALVKHGATSSHPKIVATANAISNLLKEAKGPAGLKFNEQYTPALILIFLCEADPVRFRPEAEAFLRYMQTVQKPHGGWGYPPSHQLHGETGDTSMTQYGVLSMWTAKNVGLPVSPQVIQRMTYWLMRTQDPSGAHGYQGKLASGGSLVQQPDIRPTMAVAGIGSLHVCADLVGLSPKSPKDDEDKPPAALVEVTAEGRRPEQENRPRVDEEMLRAALGRGNQWVANHYDIAPASWTYYYMYSFERYASFREKVEGREEESPRWYNDGVRYLLDKQEANGSWKGQGGEDVDTAFAVLFLMRSTQKSIQKAADYGGTLIGGRGLPKDTDAMVFRDGKYVSVPKLGDITKVLAAMEDADDEDLLSAMESVAELPPEEAQTLVSQHVKKFQSLAGDGSPEARLSAVMALAEMQDMDNVPTLIYALSDPQLEVMQAARDALRRLSRKFDGFGLPDSPTDVQIREAIRKWKAWYLAVRPDAEFVE